MNWIAHHWADLAGTAIIILENVLPYTPLKANSTVQLVIGRVKLVLPKRLTGGAYVDVNLHRGFGIPGEARSGFAHVLHITDLSPALAYKAIVGKRFDWDIIPAQWLHALEIHDHREEDGQIHHKRHLHPK